MTEDEQSKTAPPVPSPAPSPEAAANARIKDLQARIIALQTEVKMLQGRFSNRDPRLLRLIKAENAELGARAQLLEKALQGLMLDALEPRNAEEEATRYSILREATVELCKNTNVDPEIWKSLASS
jgi:hypothetical protein